MTKKKPDFLRDLDTAIMDELTGGGIKGNAAGLVGTLTQIKEIKQLCGLPFCGYMAKVETVIAVASIWAMCPKRTPKGVVKNGLDRRDNANKRGKRRKQGK